MAHGAEVVGGDVADLAGLLRFCPLLVLLEDDDDVALLELQLHLGARLEVEQRLRHGPGLVGLELVAGGAEGLGERGRDGNGDGRARGSRKGR